MTTLADLTNRLRQADRPDTDLLNGDITSAAEILVAADGSKVPAGSLIAIDLETMLVREKQTVAECIVVRGHEGTAAAAHTDDDTIFVNPRYTPAKYAEAINAALDAISIAFGRPQWDETQSFSSTNRLIKVPAAATRLLGIFEKPSTTTTDLRGIPARFMRSAPTSLVTSGKAAHLIGSNPGTGTAYIHYETPWTSLTASASTLDSEFPADAEDLIHTGAQAYLADADAFRRMAYDAAHTRLQTRNSELDSVRLAAREHLSRFLARRLELGAIYREDNYAWIKGVG